MTRLDRLVVLLLVAMVVALAVIATYVRVRRWLDGRYLREQQRQADARLAEYERRKREHAESREEFRERLRRERGEP